MSAPAHRPEPLSLRLDAQMLPARLADVRGRMASWATALGLTTDMVEDVVLATHEALANVADHAYEQGAGRAYLDAECGNGQVCVVVRDLGRWVPPADEPGWRGRGLLIIRGLADHVDVRHDASGTTVTMRWPLPAPSDERVIHGRRGDR